MPRKVCHVCKKESQLVSGFLRVCLECLRFKSHSALPYVKKAHEESRVVFNLPKSAPEDAGGKTCSLCALSCQISEGGYGYCGLKKVRSNERVSCVCFFGGDPSAEVHFAINFSQRALKRKKKLRICWETNGLFSKKFLKKVVELLNTHRKEVHLALTGYTNEAILENFAEVAKYFDQRKSVPLLTASTLLVPGYILPSIPIFT